MEWIRYGVWALALFFAGSWTFGLATSPRNRTGGNILTVVLWWVAITACALGQFTVLHLLWVFPLLLLLPVIV